MPITTQKFIRKPLYVDAVRVTNGNFDEIVAWCQGEVQQDEVPGEGTGKKYIKVRVHNPKNPRQTKAFVGDWLLYTERGYKIYTNKAFHASFDKVKAASTEELQAAFGKQEAQEAQKTQQIPKFYIDPDSGELTEEKPHKHARPLQLPEIMDIVRNEIIGEELQVPVGGPPLSEMSEAIRVVEAEGGTVEAATPEAIAQAVEENDRVIHRDAGSGEFVTEEFAETNPETTVAETIEVPGNTVETQPEQENIVPAAAEGKRVLSIEEQDEMDADEIRELIRSGEVVLAQDLAA